MFIVPITDLFSSSFRSAMFYSAPKRSLGKEGRTATINIALLTEPYQDSRRALAENTQSALLYELEAEGSEPNFMCCVK